MSIGNLEIGICDDSPEDMKRIKSSLKRNVEILGEGNISLYLYQDGKELYRDSKNRNFSLVFLECKMPGLEGFNLAEKLYIENPNLKVVFVSNYESLVFEAYEYTPLWFVRKSVLEYDMLRALQKFFHTVKKTRLRYKMKDGFGYRSVWLNSILYAECSGHVLTVWMRDHTSLQVYGTLKSLEGEWGTHDFIRIHKNYLVNIKYIQEIGVRTVRLLDGAELDMAKNRRKKITALVNEQKERLS